MPYKIMVVDDEPDLRVLINQSFRKKIKENRLLFSFASNGAEALELLKQDPVDLVLTDINMPRMDGLTLLSHLTEEERILKTVVVSAYGDMKNIRTAMNRGAYDFLIKPIDLEDLNITIDRTLEHIEYLKDARDNQRDMDAAWQLQKNILPRKLPHCQNVEVAAQYVPMKSIGGDFYDFHTISDHETGFFIADVSGHGVPAALISSMLKVAFGIIKDLERNPAELLKRLNRIMHGKLHSSFFTAAYCYVDHKSMFLRAARAGHPPLLVYRPTEDTFHTLHPSGKLMGWFPELECEEMEFKLQQKDRIFLYTDGILEAENEEQEFFGEARLEDLIRQYRDLNAGALTQKLLEEVRAFDKNTRGLEDDLTLLVLDMK